MHMDGAAKKQRHFRRLLVRVKKMVSIKMGEFVQNHQFIIGVVDPRPEDYWQIADAAEAEGLACRFCASGSEAVHLAQHSRVALWLIHSELTDMSGLELCQLLRPQLRGTPVFFIADDYDAQLELAVLSTGNLHFACKPIFPDLLQCVRRAAGRLTSSRPHGERRAAMPVRCRRAVA